MESITNWKMLKTGFEEQKSTEYYRPGVFSADSSNKLTLWQSSNNKTHIHSVVKGIALGDHYAQTTDKRTPHPTIS